MFNTLIIQPIFNLLVFVYALLPGHDFGLAIILFTLVVRIAMWPLIKKQLHHARAMQKLQPELARIKSETKGDRQREAMLVMQLYKEREIKPFASIGLLLVQLPILIALYAGIRRLVDDPTTLLNATYPFIKDLSWMKQVAANISQFDTNFMGLVDLKRAASSNTGVYWPAMAIVALSSAAQYIQSKQLLPQQSKSRSLKQILKEAGEGKKAEQSDVNAAVGRSTRFFLPALIFIFTVGIPAAFSLYFLASGVIALIQQRNILKKDEEELVSIADKSAKKEIIEGEIIETKAKNPKPKTKKTNRKKRKKR